MTTGKIEFQQKCMRCGFSYPNTLSHDCKPKYRAVGASIGTEVTVCVNCVRLQAENQALRSQVEAYEKALKVYSQQANWKHVDGWPQLFHREICGYSIAQKALKATEGV
jgi:hypothetical protein